MQVKAVAAEDAARARQLLDQVRQLGGGFGEGAAADQLHALDRTLPGAVK
jgi:hypothetical protein